MSQATGKPKTMSSSKRHFTVVNGNKEHGLYVSSSPSSAAKKVVSKLCGKEKGKKVEFYLREITQGSKKKTYGPYLGHIEKLAKPIKLKGIVFERKPVAHLKAKNNVKKGGMRGGEEYTDSEKEFMNLYEKTLEKPLNNSTNNESIDHYYELVQEHLNPIEPNRTPYMKRRNRILILKKIIDDKHNYEFEFQTVPSGNENDKGGIYIIDKSNKKKYYFTNAIQEFAQQIYIIASRYDKRHTNKETSHNNRMFYPGDMNKTIIINGDFIRNIRSMLDKNNTKVYNII